MEYIMIEKRIVELEGGIQEVKLMQLELAEKSARLQRLIELMEQQLNQFERSVDPEVNQGELLRTYGIMKSPKQEAGSDELSTKPTP